MSAVMITTPADLSLLTRVRYEIALIRAALDKVDGSQTRAAQMLGVKVTTLNTKIKRHQIIRCKS